MISRMLIAASAAIILFVGSLHLAYVLFTHEFSPIRDRARDSVARSLLPVAFRAAGGSRKPGPLR